MNGSPKSKWDCVIHPARWSGTGHQTAFVQSNQVYRSDLSLETHLMLDNVFYHIQIPSVPLKMKGWSI